MTNKAVMDPTPTPKPASPKEAAQYEDPEDTIPHTKPKRNRMRAGPVGRII